MSFCVFKIAYTVFFLRGGAAMTHCPPTFISVGRVLRMLLFVIAYYLDYVV